MRIGMSIPSTMEGIDRDTLIQWIQRIDTGPFSRLCSGERIASPFLDLGQTLAAAALLTERVPIQSLITLLPLHETVLAAKQAATLDVLSGGRFTLGVGVGVREYDYELMSRGDVFPKRLARLDEQVATLRELWSGKRPHPDAPGIGPTPVQPGGPPIFSSSLGPKSMARSARWADGLAGFHMGPDLDAIEKIFRSFEAAWKNANRVGRPTLQMAFWFGLGPGADERVRAYAHSYLQIFGDAFASRQSALCSATSADAVRDTLRGLEDRGCDEAILTPTTASLDELSRAEDFAARGLD